MIAAAQLGSQHWRWCVCHAYLQCMNQRLLSSVQLDPTAGGPPPPADLGTIAARVAAGSATGWGAAAPYSAPAEVLADVWALWEHCRASPRMNDSMLCVPHNLIPKP
jgi:hypothetical protein